MSQWSSASVAGVTDGIVYAVGAGSTTVTAQAESITKSVAVTVAAPAQQSSSAGNPTQTPSGGSKSNGGSGTSEPDDSGTSTTNTGGTTTTSTPQTKNGGGSTTTTSTTSTTVTTGTGTPATGTGITVTPATGTGITVTPATPGPTQAPSPIGTLFVTITLGGAEGCQAPSDPGCPEYVTINGSGWAPDKTYPLTITGPNLTGNTGQTETTNSDGDIYISQDDSGGGFVNQTNAMTSAPPTAGTYTVTMDGVTASYTYVEPPEAVNVFVFNFPSIQIVATGFAPDANYPITTTLNGAVIYTNNLTTDETGSIDLTDGTAGNIPFGVTGTITVTFGGVSGTAVATSS